MALPSNDEIYLPLLQLVVNHRIYSIKEAEKILAQTFNLTNEDLEEKAESGDRKFYSQVSFSMLQLIKAGLIFEGFKPFRTVDEAKRLLAKKPKKITNHDIDELIKRRKALKAKREEELEQKLLFTKYDEYLQKLKRIHPTYFEKVCGWVLARVYDIDFSKHVEITPPCNDGGIDGIVYLGEDKNSKIYFESKRYTKGSVSRKLVQQFSGALDTYRGVKGYYITTGEFASRAEGYVKEIKGYKNITLIDGHKLVELIFKYKLENEIKLD